MAGEKLSLRRKGKSSVKKPSMRDIAKEVGTSAVTVSKALAGKPGMSETLRNRILKAADEMGYVYPDGERQAGKQSLNIGILIPDRYFEPESFYFALCRKVIRRLSERGHFGIMEILSRENELHLARPNLIEAGRADGLILLGETEKSYYRMAAQTGIPVVFMDFYDEQGNADAVVGDNTYGTYRLTGHLIREGHREIGFVGSRQATGSIMDRYLGYYRAMMTAELPIREEWVIPDRGKDGRLAEPELPEKLPTAFVCNCDLTAERLIRKLRERGLEVPGDISVTGFDDYIRGPEPEIGLSTFRVNTEDMAELTVRRILERCAGDTRPFGRIVIGGQPVYRESDGPRKA